MEGRGDDDVGSGIDPIVSGGLSKVLVDSRLLVQEQGLPFVVLATQQYRVSLSQLSEMLICAKVSPCKGVMLYHITDLDVTLNRPCIW